MDIWKPCFSKSVEIKIFINFGHNILRTFIKIFHSNTLLRNQNVMRNIFRFEESICHYGIVTFIRATA